MTAQRKGQDAAMSQRDQFQSSALLQCADTPILATCPAATQSDVTPADPLFVIHAGPSAVIHADPVTPIADLLCATPADQLSVTHVDQCADHAHHASPQALNMSS